MAGHLIRRRRASGLLSPPSQPLAAPHAAVLPLVDEALSSLGVPVSIVKREPRAETTSSSSPAKSCGPNDTRSMCEKPVSGSNSTTLPIVLGVVIPLTVALVIFLVLHRRHVRKLRSEDANDRHKPLDFGMEDVVLGKKRGAAKKKGNAIPEMSLADTEKTLGRGRGMSMDMDMANPYLLPPELQQSRESLHSLSRTMNNGDDKYRPATTFIPNDGTASRLGSNSRAGDDSSSYTASTRRAFGEKETELNQSLLRNAQRMSRSVPPTRRTSLTSDGSVPLPQDQEQMNRLPPKLASPVVPNGNLAPITSEPSRDSFRSDISKDGHTAGLRKSNDYLGAFIRSGGPAAVESKVHEEKSRRTPSPPQEKPASKVHEVKDASPPKVAIDSEPLNFDFPTFDQSGTPLKTDTPVAETLAPEVARPTDHEVSSTEQYEQDFDYDVRRLTMGIRPLPPDDPSEDPEQRAIRIRSFYKEYFDEGKHGPVYTPEDYQTGSEGFAYDGPIYDETSGQFLTREVPFAQPIARRAMTPPPRGPSSFQAPGRLTASRSGGHFVNGGPRAHSSASGRFGVSNRGPPRQKLPPPVPLQILPTPHLLKDDSIIPMDFAPPSSFRERRAGTPDSPRGGMRPYSPALPAHLPLASSFDDLAVMPSPHALRKSGTFTALDFAPPPRFRSSTDTRSDSGSIRSNRSGISAAQLHSIRAGAYRVSRIPQGLGGTKQEFADTLRPQWDMRK